MRPEPSLERSILSSRQIVLRPALRSDEPLLRRWLRDPEIYTLWGGEPASDAHVLQHCAVQRDADGTSWPFVITSKEQPVGYIQAWQGNDGSGGIDVFVDPKERRQGIGSLAGELLATHLRDVWGWRRITADPAVENVAGIAMWERAGFTQTGEIVDIGDGPCVLMVFRKGAGPGKPPPWT